MLQFVEGKDRYAGLVALSLWRRTPGGDIPEVGEMNPFDRTVSSESTSQGEAAYVGVWRTVLARFEGETP